MGVASQCSKCGKYSSYKTLQLHDIYECSSRQNRPNQQAVNQQIQQVNQLINTIQQLAQNASTLIQSINNDQQLTPQQKQQVINNLNSGINNLKTVADDLVKKRIRKNKYGVLQMILQPHRINKLLERFTQQELADIFEINERTIRRLKKPNSTPKKAGRKRKLSQESLLALRLYAIAIKDFTQKKEIKHFIEVIIPFLLKSDANIFFLDECGFHLNEAPRRGYYLKNERLVALNSEKFHKFLTEFNPPNNGKKNYLIMDKLPVHKANQSCIDLKLTPIKELLKSKNVEIIFLPSCTPELNPAEKCFNITRQHIEKSRAREKDKLDLAIEEKNNGNGIIEISDIAEINSHPNGDLFLIYHKDKEIDEKLSYFSLLCFDLEPPECAKS
nr:12350_t:CDS:2 [Entrophospora candida]